MVPSGYTRHHPTVTYSAQCQISRPTKASWSEVVCHIYRLIPVKCWLDLALPPMHDTAPCAHHAAPHQFHRVALPSLRAHPATLHHLLCPASPSLLCSASSTTRDMACVPPRAPSHDAATMHSLHYAPSPPNALPTQEHARRRRHSLSPPLSVVCSRKAARPPVDSVSPPRPCHTLCRFPGACLCWAGADALRVLCSCAASRQSGGSRTR